VVEAEEAAAAAAAAAVAAEEELPLPSSPQSYPGEAVVPPAPK
jgi:hypothetical protein